MLSKEEFSRHIKNITLWVSITQLGLLVGIEAVYIAVFAGDVSFNDAYGNPSLQVIGLATSLYPIFAALGAMSVLYFIHAIREVVILGVSAYLWFIGYLMGSLLAGNMVALMTARVIKGLAIGLLTSVLPLYVEKVASSKQQAAKLLTLFQTAVPLGILLMALVAKVVSNEAFSMKWMQTAIPAFPIIMLIFNLPQKTHADVIDQLGQTKQLQDISSAFTKLKQDFIELTHSHKSIVRCLAAILAQSAGPITAINVIFYYSSTMCRMLGFEDEAAGYIALGLYACNFVGTAASLLVINRLPRIPTIQYSVLGMAGIHGILFAVRLLQEQMPDNNVLGLVAISLLFIFVGLFSILFAGMSLVYTSEIVSVKTRGISIGIATACGWLCNFAIAMISAALLPFMGSYLFLLFAYLCCAIYALFAFMPSPVQVPNFQDEEVDW